MWVTSEKISYSKINFWFDIFPDFKYYNPTDFYFLTLPECNFFHAEKQNKNLEKTIHIILFLKI